MIILFLVFGLSTFVAKASIGPDSGSEITAKQNSQFLFIDKDGEKHIFMGGRDFSALKHYKISISLEALNPKSKNQFGGLDEDTLILKANQHYNRGAYNEALNHVLEVIRRNEKSVRAWIMRGSLLYVLKQKDLAIKAWRQALKLEPGNRKVQIILETLQ